MTTVAVKNGAPNWPAMCEVRNRAKVKTQIDKIKNTSSSIWFDTADMKKRSSQHEEDPTSKQGIRKHGQNEENKWQQKHLYASKKTQLVRQCPDCQLLFGAFHTCKQG
jgi:hypothetical protein